MTRSQTRRLGAAARRAGLAVLLALAWHAGDGVPARADTASVTIDNFTFTPADLTVSPGTTVTWTNADDIPHTVTESDHTFRSKPLDTNDRFSFKFTRPGTYQYFCSLHPHMTGHILVKAP